MTIEQRKVWTGACQFLASTVRCGYSCSHAWIFPVLISALPGISLKGRKGVEQGPGGVDYCACACWRVAIIKQMCALQSKRIVAILLHFSKFLGCRRKAAWHNCTSCSFNLLKTQTGSGAVGKMVWVENEELVDNKSYLTPHATTYIWAQRLVSPICSFDTSVFQPALFLTSNKHNVLK